MEIFGFSTDTIGEKLNFYYSDILNSPLVPVLSPIEIEEKYSKKVFTIYKIRGLPVLILFLNNN
jgi:hypothetical protein